MNIRPETIIYTDKNIDTKVMNIRLRWVFVNLTPKAREVKAKINDWNYIKLKSVYIAKETSNKRERQQK